MRNTLDDLLDDMAKGPFRLQVPLADAEPQPFYWFHQPAPGYRWEPDDELRARVKASQKT